MQEPLRVVAHTGPNIGHDLFCFEQPKDLNIKELVAPAVQGQSTKVVRGGEGCMTVRMTGPNRMGQGECELAPGDEELIRLSRYHGEEAVTVEPSLVSKLWCVVPKPPSASQSLSEGDRLRLGRRKFRVCKLYKGCGDAEPDCVRQRFNFNPLSGNRTCSAVDSESACCRICLMEESSEDDPFIAPCQCRGSIEHVHLQCLRQWQAQRLRLDSPSGVDDESHFYPHAPCDLCKTDYAAEVQYDGKKEPLIEGPHFTTPTVILEDVKSRGFFAICLKDGKIGSLGRTRDCDAVVKDTSTSRVHAHLRFHEGKFLIQDNGSRFGTFIARKRMKLLPGDSISVQVGNTVLAVSLRGAEHDVSQAGEVA